MYCVAIPYLKQQQQIELKTDFNENLLDLSSSVTSVTFCESTLIMDSFSNSHTALEPK